MVASLHSFACSLPVLRDTVRNSASHHNHQAPAAGHWQHDDRYHEAHRKWNPLVPSTGSEHLGREGTPARRTFSPTTTVCLKINTRSHVQVAVGFQMRSLTHANGVCLHTSYGVHCQQHIAAQGRRICCSTESSAECMRLHNTAEQLTVVSNLPVARLKLPMTRCLLSLRYMVSGRNETLAVPPGAIDCTSNIRVSLSRSMRRWRALPMQPDPLGSLLLGQCCCQEGELCSGSVP